MRHFRFLMVGKINNSEPIQWQIPRTSATTYCHRLRFQCCLESDLIIKNKNDYIEDQVAQLYYNIYHTLLQTMVDKKEAILLQRMRKCKHVIYVRQPQRSSITSNKFSKGFAIQ